MINPTRKITFLSANSFDATKPMENRLMSFIHEALHRNYDVTLITPDRAESQLKIQNSNMLL